MHMDLDERLKTAVINNDFDDVVDAVDCGARKLLRCLKFSKGDVKSFLKGEMEHKLRNYDWGILTYSIQLKQIIESNKVDDFDAIYNKCTLQSMAKVFCKRVYCLDVRYLFEKVFNALMRLAMNCGSKAVVEKIHQKFALGPNPYITSRHSEYDPTKQHSIDAHLIHIPTIKKEQNPIKYRNPNFDTVTGSISIQNNLNISRNKRSFNEAFSINQ